MAHSRYVFFTSLLSLEVPLFGWWNLLLSVMFDMFQHDAGRLSTLIGGRRSCHKTFMASYTFGYISQGLQRDWKTCIMKMVMEKL